MPKRCPHCDYDLSGISGKLCPECGRSPRDADGSRAASRVTAFQRLLDIEGLSLLIIFNVVLLLVGGGYVIKGRTSWFTDVLFSTFRLTVTVQTGLLALMTILALWWERALGESSMRSYREQQVALVLFVLLTIAHGVGVVSLVY